MRIVHGFVHVLHPAAVCFIVQIDISPEFFLKLPFRICCVSLLVSLQVETLTESERESVALLSAVSRTTAEVSSTKPLDVTSLIVD